MQFYDASDNQAVQLTRADGKYYLNTYTWNSSGQKTYMTYNGLAYAYTYDSLDNILTVSVNGKQLVQYIYGYDYEDDEENAFCIPMTAAEILPGSVKKRRPVLRKKFLQPMYTME